jgi:hypothetical protein
MSTDNKLGVEARLNGLLKVCELLVLLCQKASTPPGLVTTRSAGPPAEEDSGELLVDRGDRRGDMPFRPHRERPAA